MATGYTREWIQFFTGCGIPDDVATMYALIFYENRIQKNMLLDLNKEYLRDMGITVMGDVIAILRYAKIVHEKYVRDRILSVDGNLPVEKNSEMTESSPIKKSTAVKRILEHYVRRYNSSEEELIGEMQVILPNEKAASVSKNIPQKTGVQTPSPKKIAINLKNTKSTNLKEKGLEVPVPKIRRVLPENEGGYKIKMPSGTTERSKKLLEQAKKRKTKTVFDRLGESSVSSTTSEVSTTSSATSNHLKGSSVFARLGEKTSAVSSTSSIDDTEAVAVDQLPYAGILKNNGLKKNIPKTTMRADELQKSERRKLASKKGVSVKKRLGLAQQSPGIEPPNKTIIKTTATPLKKGELRTKETVLNVKTKVNSPVVGPKKILVGFTNKNFNQVESKQGKVTVSTTQVQKPEVRGLKRKLEADSSLVSDTSPSKKVRFGKTTHRLIPSSSTSTEYSSNVKNYPKLTMIINNTTSAEYTKFSTDVKTGSLNSDKIKQKIGIKDRIGNKSVQVRLGKRSADSMTGVSSPKKSVRIQDRLG